MAESDNLNKLADACDSLVKHKIEASPPPKKRFKTDERQTTPERIAHILKISRDHVHVAKRLCLDELSEIPFERLVIRSCCLVDTSDALKELRSRIEADASVVGRSNASSGNTPLHIAFTYKMPTVVDILLAHADGESLLRKNGAGLTPLGVLRHTSVCIASAQAKQTATAILRRALARLKELGLEDDTVSGDEKDFFGPQHVP